jgi:hypothetical protein
MEYVVPILFVAAIFFLGVTARAWQRRHTYMEEFWRSNGW